MRMLWHTSAMPNANAGAINKNSTMPTPGKMPVSSISTKMIHVLANRIISGCALISVMAFLIHTNACEIGIRMMESGTMAVSLGVGVIRWAFSNPNGVVAVHGAAQGQNAFKMGRVFRCEHLRRTGSIIVI